MIVVVIFQIIIKTRTWIMAKQVFAETDNV
jgi:hypothetical protein